MAKCVNSQGEVNTNSDGRCSFAVSDGWERYWVTWTLKTTGNTSVPKYIMIRTNNAVSGQTVYICGCKLEKGNKITDWTPAVEDTETAISDASIANWCYNNNTTYINGGKIYTGTVTADKIAANAITAEKIATDAIKSNNYVANTSGSFLNLADGSFDSKYFKVSSTGSITATGGKIGGWNIGSGLSTTSNDGLISLTISPVTISGIPWLYVGKKSGNTDTSWSYPFQLLSDGSVKCQSITINSGGSGLVCSNDNGVRSSSVALCESEINFSYKNYTVGATSGTASVYMTNYSQNTACLKILSSSILYLAGKSILSSTSISNVSDARMKNHISNLPADAEKMFDYLDGKSFFYNDSVSTQKSYGFIAQDVLSALTSAGLTTDDFAGFCDINGDGSQYALAYDQFIPIMWDEIKRLRKQVKELKGEL